MWPTVQHQRVPFPFSRPIADQSPVAIHTGQLTLEDYAIQIRHFLPDRSAARVVTRDRDQSRTKGKDLTT